MEDEYREDRNGRRIVMSYDVFKQLDYGSLCQTLGIFPSRPYESRPVQTSGIATVRPPAE